MTGTATTATTPTAISSTESPFSINWRMTDPSGIECQFTVRAVEQPKTLEDTLDVIDLRAKLIESMLAEGWAAAQSFSRGTPTAGAATADPNTPSCAHGQRVRRSGQGKKGPWAGYMCSARKCDPVWID